MTTSANELANWTGHFDQHGSLLVSRSKLSVKNRTMADHSFQIGHHEIKTVAFWKAVSAEILATAILMIVQCSTPLKWPGNNDSGTTVQIALGMGFVVMCLAESVGHISGAQMNPAVAIAMFLAQKISLLRAILYVVAQCIGAIAGSGLVYVVTSPNATGNFATTTVNPLLSPAQGMVVEMYLTFILVFVIFGATDSARKLTMPGIAIGLTVAMDVLSGINHTGASMNPARSLGPAVYVNIWTDHWVYWVGPILGGALATLVYRYGFNPVKQEDENCKTEVIKEQELRHVVEEVFGRFRPEVTGARENGNI
ncbi:aquaporin AQPAe.a [Lingula anatina]|uniref:Aquaporin AQPAe.a n=1 Tax=Lingula anatina TaxID=7574 RepID=A0A1S3HW64_LINAN|nr:aquaporin AQPAe.a [Lingula anatina]|eukprot:XP_013390275.1 aquaporin AQPAe.a [Lingula anatina]